PVRLFLDAGAGPQPCGGVAGRGEGQGEGDRADLAHEALCRGWRRNPEDLRGPARHRDCPQLGRVSRGGSCADPQTDRPAEQIGRAVAGDGLRPQGVPPRHPAEVHEVTRRTPHNRISHMADASDTKIDPRWAWEAYRPNDKAPWDLKRAGHLYRRAAFGATYTELQAALKKGPQKAIDDLLAGGPNQESFDKQTEALAESTVRVNNG